MVDLSFVGDNDTNRVRCLTTCDSRFGEVRFWQAEPDIVALEGAVPDQNRVGQRALAKQMQLVFARSEIDRREIAGGNFSINRHGKGRAHKWTVRFSRRGWQSPGGFTSAR